MTLLAIVKPDYGNRGGFESLVTILADRLRERGTEVHIVPVPTDPPGRHVVGYPMEPVFNMWHHEYFHYMAMLQRVRSLNLSRYDAIVATQPPTFHATGAPVLGLFYHHGRIFYDLADEYVAAGFVSESVHAPATEQIRLVDQEAVRNVAGWLAPSATVEDRLSQYWGLERAAVDRFAHPNVADVPTSPPPGHPGTVLCVSRHEWPKRTELVVAAAPLLSNTHIHLVGGGSRLEYAKSLDAQLAGSPEQQNQPSRTLWANPGPATPGWRPSQLAPSGKVTFHGRVSDPERDQLYAKSGIVVAPALNEDYGLTALEAFAWQRPLIVCNDGGGLCEFVEHRVSGLVVEPTPIAIAEAVSELQADPALRAAVVEGGKERLAELSWDSALAQFDRSLNILLRS